MPGDSRTIFAYETPHGRLVVGIRKDERRPAIWIVPKNGEPLLLGRLNGDDELRALVAMLDSAWDQIIGVIEHYKKLNGETKT